MQRHIACIAVFFAGLHIFPALAAQRTFVATTGSDAAACSIAAPCRGFARAITQTDSGGEIVVLDSGGYGAVTIAQSVAITSPAGIYAGISVFAGDGVLVNGAGIVVTLRGLTINGIGAVNGTGVRFQQGARLVVDRCDLSNLSDSGIEVQAPSAFVSVVDTSVVGSFAGIRTSIDAAGADLRAERVRIERSLNSGIDVQTATNLVLRDVAISRNANYGVFVSLAGSGKRARIEFDRVSSVRNGSSGIALWAQGDATTGIEGSIAGSLVADNGFAGIDVNSNVVGSEANSYLTISDAVVRGNGWVGISATLGLASYVVVTRNVIAGNAFPGIQTDLGGTRFQSRGDNAVHGNNGGGAQTFGTITALGGI
jgi:hypothetical protein